MASQSKRANVDSPFEPSFALELATVSRGVRYYETSMPALLETELGRTIAGYYQVGSGTPARLLRFKAFFFATRLQPVLDYVTEFLRVRQRPPRLLDVGCGYGLESSLLAAAGAEVTAIDLDAGKIAGARQATPILKHESEAHDVHYVRCSVTTFEAEADFDVIYSSATLHHIEPLAPACTAISRLLGASGRFFLSDENGASPVQQLLVQRAIGWTSRRVVPSVDAETGQPLLYGNENIRAPFVWRRHFRRSGLESVGLKYCRLLPPLDLEIASMLRAERALRALPFVRELGAIGFVAGFAHSS